MNGFQLQKNEKALIMCSENVSSELEYDVKKFSIQETQWEEIESVYHPSIKEW